jgi:hypothetical protein
MGDFDKNQAPKDAGEKKKLVIVGLLGAVLLGVVYFHFMKSGPAVANAGIAPAEGAQGVVAALRTDETAAQARAALEADPTKHLLTGGTELDPALEKVPHNPFRMSDKWRATFVKQAVVTPRVEIVPRVTDPKDPVVINTPAVAVDTRDMKLMMITRGSRGLQAIINGNIVSVGQTVGSARVIEIKPDSVTLQHVDFPDGPTSSLTIARK